MQGISIFQQIYAPRVAHVVTGFDGVSHNTHSPYAMGGVVGSVGKMTAIVANDQADTWHIVNLKCGKIFDAVAVLGAFDESEAANMAMRYHGQYFDAVCGDACESNTGGLQRFLNHPVYMRTNRPVYAEELAKLQDIPSTQAILWDGVQLKSHNGSSKHLLLDMMRCDDDKALLEKMDFVEEESQLDGEIAEYDALVVEAYKLENTVSKLALAMDKATSISTLKVANQTLSKPKTMRGFGVIQQLVSFELSDGQAVSIIFNVSDSEANASAKMTKDDLLVAWKYKLNSRDITAAVQPNATQNVSLNMIASRIMGLADANSEKFVAAQKKKDAMQTELVNTNQRVKDLQGQEQSLIQEIADLQKQLDEKAKNNKALEVRKGEKDYKTYSIEAFVENKHMIKDKRLGNSSRVSTTIKAKHWKEIARITDTLDAAIDIFEGYSSHNKLRLVETYTGTVISKKNGKLDLDNKTLEAQKAEKESKFIDNPKKKLGDEDKFNLPTNSTVILDLPITAYRPKKMRVVEREAENATFYEVDAFSENMSKWINLKSYADKEKAILGAKGWYPEIITEEENKPQDRAANWRTNLESARDVAKSLGIETKDKKLERLVMDIDKAEALPNRDELDPTKLAELGVATITSIGHAENIYIEKDGKQYYSKVGNPQLYALGEWDFAKYPDGKQVAPVAQPEPEPVTLTGKELGDVPTPTPAAKSTDLTEEEYAALKKAYDEFKAKTDKIGAAKSREDALKIATDLVTEMPEKEEQIRRAFSDAIRDNGWGRFEINFPKQPVKVDTDMELNRTLKRLQKALEETAYSVNGKFNYGSAKLSIIYNNGGSSYNQKYVQKSIDKINGKFVVIHDVYTQDTVEFIKPLVDGMLSWLNGETVPKMFLGNDLKWDTQIGTPRVIDDAFKEAKAKAAPAAPVAQPNNTLQKDISKSELFKDANVWAIDDFGKENGMVIYSRDEQDGFSIGIVDKLKQVNMQYTDIDTDQQTNESFSTENITNEQVIEKIKMFIAKHEQKSVELLPVQPVSKPPVVEQDNAEKNMTAADFLALGGKEWVKDDMTRIYINAKVFNDLMGTSFSDSNNKFFFDVNTSALMRSYKGKRPQIEKQYEPVQQQSSEPVSKPPMTNPDRDYLQSIIDGDVDPLIVDIDAVIALAEKYDGDAEITPLLDQALEVINQAEQEAAKGI